MISKKKRQFKETGAGKLIYLSEEELLERPFQWNSYVCSPCEDCCNCLLVCCCPILAIYDIIRLSFDVNNFVALCMCLIVPCWPFFIIFTRRKVRISHNLEGNICSDVACVLSCIFAPFVTCQLRNEIMFLKKAGLWELGDRNDFGVFCERCTTCNKVVKYFQSDSDVLEYAMKNNLFDNVNPEEAMIKLGKIRREYERYIVTKADSSSLSSSVASKFSNDSNACRGHSVSQQVIVRV